MKNNIFLIINFEVKHVIMEQNTIALFAIYKCIDIKVLNNAFVKMAILIKLEISFVWNVIILG